MKIGISGASGQLGAATIRHLQKRGLGDSVVAISRTPGSVAGVEARFGDYDDPGSLISAYAGLDRLMLIPTVDLRAGARARQTTAAVAAAVAAGVSQILYLSSLGVRDVAEPDVWAGYFATEQALMRQAAGWTILRMGYYIESFIAEVQQSLGHGVHAALADAPVTFVSRDDLAAAAAGILATEGHGGAIYQGTGTRTHTGSERAAAVSAASGKPFAFVPVTAEQYAGGLRAAQLPEEVVTTILSIQSGFAAGGFDLVSGDVARLAGQAPVSLESMLAATFG